MAEWTLTDIAVERKSAIDRAPDQVVIDSESYIKLLDLAARGLAATEDAAKARALEEGIRDLIIRDCSCAHCSSLRRVLCPAPTKTGESDG